MPPPQTSPCCTICWPLSMYVMRRRMRSGCFGRKRRENKIESEECGWEIGRLSCSQPTNPLRVVDVDLLRHLATVVRQHRRGRLSLQVELERLGHGRLEDKVVHRLRQRVAGSHHDLQQCWREMARSREGLESMQVISQCTPCIPGLPGSLAKSKVILRPSFSKAVTLGMPEDAAGCDGPPPMRSSSCMCLWGGG